MQPTLFSHKIIKHQRKGDTSLLCWIIKDVTRDYFDSVPTIKSTNNRAKADDMRRKIDKSTRSSTREKLYIYYFILSRTLCNAVSESQCNTLSSD